MTERKYGRRTNIFCHGDPADGLYVVDSGRIRMFQSNADGEEFTIAIWSAGYNVGLISSLLNQGRVCSLESVEETSLLVLPRAALLELMREIPIFAVNIAKLVASLSSESLALWSPLALDSAAERLCKFMYRVAEPYDLGDIEGNPIVVRGLNQDDLATMVGVTRTWVTLMLSTFEANGLIWRRRHEIGIYDMDMLKRFCATHHKKTAKSRRCRMTGFEPKQNISIPSSAPALRGA